MEPDAKIIRVAYAEDHAAVRAGIKNFIEEDGSIQVCMEAANGEELLHLLIMADQKPDVCLIDINMPKMNGFTLLVEIRKRWPDLPCIILTAFVEEYYIIEMIKKGANGYLHKNCSPDEIAFAIKTVYEDGFFSNEVLDNKMVHHVNTVKHKIPVLNEREEELLKYVCSDLSYADIAVKMNTTFKTVDGIRMRLCNKLSVNTRVALALAAVRMGFFTIESEIHIKGKPSSR